MPINDADTDDLAVRLGERLSLDLANPQLTRQQPLSSCRAKIGDIAT